MENVNLDFLAGVAGDGLDGISLKSMALKYLQITSGNSARVTAEVNSLPIGVFCVTGVTESFGSAVTLIPVGVEEVWIEKDSDLNNAGQGKTLATYKPYDPNIHVERIPKGNGYFTMINSITGKKIIDTLVYAFVIPENMDLGVVFFTVPLGSMKVIRMWNTTLKSQRLPSGKSAPLYAKKWKFHINKNMVNSDGVKYVGIDKITDEGWIDGVVFGSIKENRDRATMLLLSAPTDEPDTGIPAANVTGEDLANQADVPF
jgi:hypothetical protein